MHRWARSAQTPQRGPRDNRHWEKLGVEVTAVTVALEEAGLEGHCHRERL